MTGRAQAFRFAIVAAVFAMLFPPAFVAQLIQLDPLPTDPQERVPSFSSPGLGPLGAPGVIELPSTSGPPTPRLQRGENDLAQPRDPGLDSLLLPLWLAGLSEAPGEVARLSGETATQRFFLFLPQALDAAELRLTHQTGIDALPGRSALTVSINGTAIGTVSPSHFDGFAVDTLAVPPGVLQVGRNTVEIRARHAHRVACGPDASFALWTDIDASRSGIRMPNGSFELGPAGFLAAIAAQTARAEPVTFHRPDPAASMLEAAPFIAQASIAMGGAAPEIVSAPYWVQQESRPQLARITAFPPGEGPRAPQFRRGGDGAVVLVVEQSDDYSALLADLFPPDLQPPATGVEVLKTGAPVPLSDLGVPRLRGEGRYNNLTVDFMLPWDWLLLASQSARIDLDYRFAPGLPNGALLLVKVNGVTVRLLPLDKDGGMTLPTLPVSFVARLLKPGMNRLEFETLIPGDPPNRACPELDGPVIEISEGSRLFVPQSPSMAQADLARTLSMITADTILLSDMAQAQLSPGLLPQIAAGLMVAPAESRLFNPNATLKVATLGDLDRIEGDWLSPAARRALFEILGGARARIEPAASVGTPWEAVGARTGLLDQIEARGLLDVPSRVLDRIIALAMGDTPPLTDWLATTDGQMALLQPDPGRPDDVWLVMGPGLDPAVAMRAIAAGRISHNGPRGQVALHDQALGWQSWTAPDRPLSLLRPAELGTIRAIMGNFATTAPLAFIGLLLSLAMILALVAMALLSLTRRQR